jgi:hypothetical protein
MNEGYIKTLAFSSQIRELENGIYAVNWPINLRT